MFVKIFTARIFWTWSYEFLFVTWHVFWRIFLVPLQIFIVIWPYQEDPKTICRPKLPVSHCHDANHVCPGSRSFRTAPAFYTVVVKWHADSGVCAGDHVLFHRRQLAPIPAPHAVVLEDLSPVVSCGHTTPPPDLVGHSGEGLLPYRRRGPGGLSYAVAFLTLYLNIA